MISKQYQILQIINYKCLPLISWISVWCKVLKFCNSVACYNTWFTPSAYLSINKVQSGDKLPSPVSDVCKFVQRVRIFLELMERGTWHWPLAKVKHVPCRCQWVVVVRPKQQALPVVLRIRPVCQPILNGGSIRIHVKPLSCRVHRYLYVVGESYCPDARNSVKGCRNGL